MFNKLQKTKALKSTEKILVNITTVNELVEEHINPIPNKLSEQIDKVAQDSQSLFAMVNGMEVEEQKPLPKPVFVKSSQAIHRDRLNELKGK